MKCKAILILSIVFLMSITILTSCHTAECGIDVENETETEAIAAVDQTDALTEVITVPVEPAEDLTELAETQPVDPLKDAPYALERMDGVCYLTVKSDLSTQSKKPDCSGTGISGYVLGPCSSLRFASVKEMRDAILGGTLTEEQLTYMVDHSLATENGAQIMDPATFLQPSLPFDIEHCDVVWRDAYRYTVSFADSGAHCLCDLDIGNGGTYARDVETHTAAMAAETRVIARGTYEGVDYCVMQDGGSRHDYLRSVFLLYETEEKTLRIRINYAFSAEDLERPYEELVPDSVRFTGESNGVCFNFVFHNIVAEKKRDNMCWAPTLDMLLSVGLEQIP